MSYLYRSLFSTFLQWKDSSKRKPVVLRGARQVGKSSLVKKLGQEFSSFIELNFEHRPELAKHFKQDLDAKRIIRELEVLLNISIIPGKSLLFLDEIQECPEALQSLRYFYEQIPELHVIAAGSLLEFELNKQGVPVGRVQFFHLFPLSWKEFLFALGEEKAVEYLDSCPINKPLPDPLHEKFLSLLKLYFCLGGMPEVVATYKDHQDLKLCQEVQNAIVLGYRKDFPKYTKDSRIRYVEEVFRETPTLGGNKFKASAIRAEVRSNYIFDSLDLLVRAEVLHKVYSSSANGIPLGAEVHHEKFKVITLDVGLGLKLQSLRLQDWIASTSSDFINKGAVAEQFVGQELLAYADPTELPELFYWHREERSSNAEVDYVVESNNLVVPVEVKAGATGRMKSLLLFLQEKQSSVGVKISTAHFGEERINGKKVISLPLYAVWRVREIE